MATIEGVDLGNVQKEKIRKSAGVTQIALPDSDSSDAILIPTTGPTTKISISGTYTGTKSELQTFAGYLNSWITKGGKISESNLTFVSDFNGNFNIRVVDGDWDWDAGNPNRINWNLSLVEGQFS